jgi:DNA-binding PadR family transcriptional regulator
LSMKLAILGLLMEGESHPYEIRQKMKERGMQHYSKIQDGSLYYGIEQLHKERLVEAVETVKDTNRPNKTIYRITDEGEIKFQKLLLEQLKQSTPFFHPMYVALKFAFHGNDCEIADILESKIKECEELTVRMKDLYEEHISIVPRSVLHMMWGCYEHSMTELTWLKRLHSDAVEGRLKEIGKPLDLE